MIHWIIALFFFTFNIKIENREFINIGAINHCVQIFYNERTNSAHLEWLGTERGGCEVNGRKISGEDTVVMTDLGFTILKQLYPNVDPIITLRDSSKFTCNLPINKHVTLSTMIYNLLIYGKTFYQRRFNARLKYRESEPAYDAFINARHNPEMFKKTYDFNNVDLNKAFKPILERTETWAEFFTELNNTYGRNTCALLHSWYLDVYGFLAKEPIHTDWTIDISTRPPIEYTITVRNKSKNYTKKSYVYNPYEFIGGYFPSLISYKKILHRGHARGRTRKTTSPPA